MQRLPQVRGVFVVVSYFKPFVDAGGSYYSDPFVLVNCEVIICRVELKELVWLLLLALLLLHFLWRSIRTTLRFYKVFVNLIHARQVKCCILSAQITFVVTCCLVEI